MPAHNHLVHGTRCSRPKYLGSGLFNLDLPVIVEPDEAELARIASSSTSAAQLS